MSHRILLAVLILAFTSLTNPQTAVADDPAPILGRWKTVTDMGARRRESTMEFSVVDGKLTAIGRGQRGAIDASDVSFEQGVLKWTISMRGNNIPIEVKVEGDKFSGETITPLGRFPITGERITEEMLAAEEQAIESIIGDWTIITTYGDGQHETRMRIYLGEDDDPEAVIMMPTSNATARRVRYSDGNLRFQMAMPFVSSEPATVDVRVKDNKFEGVVRSAVGEIPITGELLDTTKLVVAPYDAPDAILGAWNVHAVLGDNEQDGTLSFSEKDSRLHAVLQTPSGAYESSHVEFKKVSDTMSVARVTLSMPDVREKPLVFELIVNSDSFEGEELYSNGGLLMSGSRAKA